MRRAIRVVIFLWCGTLGCFSQGASETVEEVLATVGAAPVLSSDLDLAERVALLEREANESEGSYRSRLLDARIRLEVQFRDLEATGALHRLKVDLAPVLDTLCRPAGTCEELAHSLDGAGLVWEDVEDLALRIAATRMWVEMRLRPRITVSLDEMRAVWEDEITAELEAAGAQAPDFTAMRPQLHQLLVERKLNAEIEAWIAEAERRQEVTRFRR